ncbi:MAG: hypothetical protein AUK53_07420 [Betaproteobacteria bacterium CG2_30_59_46]|nr:MAG: hypothetical protein AUK53_07420 [Betaproteobacteria bacterium CG2_30_59_46]
MAFAAVNAHANDGFFTDGVTDSKERASEARVTEGKATKARVGAGPKTPAVKTITNFTQALRCMDELFLANGKQGIVITSAGIPDATGKARAGDKEMMISAISKMTIKSNAFEFIDLTQGASGEGDLAKLFELKGGGGTKIPDYYIRGAVTQLDDNAVRDSKGFGIALPFLDLGYSKDQSFDLISMDMSIGDASTRKILPETNTSNTMIITKGGRSGEAGGKIAKMGLSFNKDLSRTEGVGATYRTLIELGLIEALGKFTRVPYWKCLDIESTNPELLDQVREWYDVASDKDRITFIQQKLAGMKRYNGPLNGAISDELKTSIAEYQAYSGLIADGRVNFDLYFSLKDDIQNQLAALPVTQPRLAPAPVIASAAVSPVSSAPAPASPLPAVPLRMSLTSDRGGNPSYKVGEFLDMKMSLNTLGFAYCFYEDVGKNTARIFPNRFYRDSMLAGNFQVPLPTGGFKIRFDRPGRERVACVSSDRELVVPSGLAGIRDLSPLPIRSVDEVIGQFKKLNPVMATNLVEITVR